MEGKANTAEVYRYLYREVNKCKPSNEGGRTHSYTAIHIKKEGRRKCTVADESSDAFTERFLKDSVRDNQ